MLSLHAGVSTIEPRFRQAAIPVSAFEDAVVEYKRIRKQIMRGI